MFWDNKIVVVTGSCRGLGLQINLALLKRGAKVVFHSSQKTPPKNSIIETAINQNKAIFLSADLRNKAEINQFFEQIVATFGGVDIVIHNAGLSSFGPLEKLNDEVIEALLSLNLFAPIHLSKRAIPFLKQRKGSIYFISSLASFYGIPNYTLYSTTKAALAPLHQGLSLELEKNNVNTGIFYFGYIQNDQDKYAIDETGKKIAIPTRNKLLTMKQDHAVQIILRGIEKQKLEINASGYVWLFRKLSNAFPFIVRYLMRRSMEAN